MLQLHYYFMSFYAIYTLSDFASQQKLVKDVFFQHLNIQAHHEHTQFVQLCSFLPESVSLNEYLVANAAE